MMFACFSTRNNLSFKSLRMGIVMVLLFGTLCVHGVKGRTMHSRQKLRQKAHQRRMQELKTLPSRVTEKDRIGSGKFGNVYKVNWNKKNYALKILDLNNKDAQTKELFTSEINNHKLVAGEQSRAKAICKLHRYWHCLKRNEAYMLLDYLEGGTLTDLRQQFQKEDFILPENTVRFYATTLIFGLKAMHDQNVCHRDLKPDNIVLNENGYPQIIDFGFSKKLPPNGMTNECCGTERYLCPEAANNQLKRDEAGKPTVRTWKNYNGKAFDYFSFGVLLYELLIGTQPFYIEGQREQWLKNLANCDPAMMAHNRKEPEYSQYHARWERLTRNCRDFLLRLLQKDEAQRKKFFDDVHVTHPWISDHINLQTMFPKIASETLPAPYKPTRTSKGELRYVKQ